MLLAGEARLGNMVPVSQLGDVRLLVRGGIDMYPAAGPAAGRPASFPAPGSGHGDLRDRLKGESAVSLAVREGAIAVSVPDDGVSAVLVGAFGGDAGGH